MIFKLKYLNLFLLTYQNIFFYINTMSNFFKIFLFIVLILIFFLIYLISIDLFLFQAKKFYLLLL